MRGYWDDAERTAEAIDARRLDAHRRPRDASTHEGYCNIVGRIKDMVIRGGENIYPREIEEFLYRHPKIAGRAGASACRTRSIGEELCAWIMLKAGRDA